MDEDEDNVETQEDIVENHFQKTFGWYVVINRIAGNDFTKHDYILEKGVMEVLNQLSYIISHDKEQERLMKQAQNKNKY